MQIVTFDIVDPETFAPRDIEIPLQRLAESPDPLTAVKWRALLELVRVLRDDGRHPQAIGFILNDEMTIHPRNQANRATVSVRVDWYDFAPLQDGVPALHYRLEIGRRGGDLTKGVRTPDAQEVRTLIREAFGWSE